MSFTEHVMALVREVGHAMYVHDGCMHVHCSSMQPCLELPSHPLLVLGLREYSFTLCWRQGVSLYLPLGTQSRATQGGRIMSHPFPNIPSKKEPSS